MKKSYVQRKAFAVSKFGKFAIIIEYFAIATGAVWLVAISLEWFGLWHDAVDSEIYRSMSAIFSLIGIAFGEVFGIDLLGLHRLWPPSPAEVTRFKEQEEERLVLEINEINKEVNDFIFQKTDEENELKKHLQFLQLLKS